MKINYKSRPLLICVSLILIVFWDVIFFQASLRVTDLMYGGANGFPIIKLFHIREYMSWWGSFSDNGGAFIQSDPMIGFIKNCIQNAQSPYWNPYSAAGSFGPETLVDLKFSAFTLINAMLGATSLAFNFTLVAGLFFAIYFTYLLLSRFLHLSDLAALAGSIFYLLNGYSTANLGVNISHNYLFIPLYLYALFKYTNEGGGINFTILVLSISLFLSALFPPTSIISIISLNIIYIGYLINKKNVDGVPIKKILLSILGYLFAFILSLTLLAVLFLPIVEGLNTMGTLEDYSKRLFFPIYFPNSLLSFFTPTHFFELYNAMEANAVLWTSGAQTNGFNGNTVYHFGLIALILIFSTFTFKSPKSRAIVISCYVALLFFLLRLFNPPVIDAIYSKLPIIRNLGSQYLWSGIFIPCTFLVGFGVDSLKEKKGYPWGATLIVVVGLFSVYFVYLTYGFRDPFIDFKRYAIKFFIAYLLVAYAIILIIYKFKASKIRAIALSILILLMLVELLLANKWVHTKRVDFFNSPPELTQFVIDNVKLNRTMTFGAGSFTPELGSAFNVQEITSHNQGVLPDYVTFFQNNFRLKETNQMAYGVSLINAKDSPGENILNFGALNFLGVKYLIIPKEYIKYKNFLMENGLIQIKENSSTAIFENPFILPRAFTLKGEFRKEDLKKDLNKLTFEDVIPAEIKTYQNAKVSISGLVKNKSLLVLSDNWHPNWQARLNGMPVEIVRVNQSFRGVIVGPGPFEVDMEYKPKVLNFSIAISLISIALLVIIFSVSCYRKFKIRS